MSEDNVVIDFHSSPHNDPYPPSLSRKSPSHQYQHQTKIKPIQPKNKSQDMFMAAIKTHTLIFGLGPAGTGKSYCAAAMAAQALISGDIDRIIFTRPAVEAGNSMGFQSMPVDSNGASWAAALPAAATRSS